MTGLTLFAFVIAVAFLVQWVAFVPAYLLQTERFYDLTGSLTYILVAGLLVSDAGFAIEVLADASLSL